MLFAFVSASGKNSNKKGQKKNKAQQLLGNLIDISLLGSTGTRKCDRFVEKAAKKTVKEDTAKLLKDADKVASKKTTDDEHEKKCSRPKKRSRKKNNDEDRTSFDEDRTSIDAATTDYVDNSIANNRIGTTQLSRTKSVLGNFDNYNYSDNNIHNGLYENTSIFSSYNDKRCGGNNNPTQSFDNTRQQQLVVRVWPLKFLLSYL